MAKKVKDKKKLGCFIAGCSFFIIIFILIVGVSAFALLYVPDATDATEKIKTDESLSVIKYEKGDLYSEDVERALNEIKLVSDCEFAINEIVEFKSSGEVSEEEYVYGILIYTDEISSSFEVMLDYIKFLTDSSTEDASKLVYHFSPRGNVIFVGNGNGELIFRVEKCLF